MPGAEQRVDGPGHLVMEPLATIFDPLAQMIRQFQQSVPVVRLLNNEASQRLLRNCRPSAHERRCETFTPSTPGISVSTTWT